jgi:hypothetical protein
MFEIWEEWLIEKTKDYENKMFISLCIELH